MTNVHKFSSRSLHRGDRDECIRNVRMHECMASPLQPTVKVKSTSFGHNDALDDIHYEIRLIAAHSILASAVAPRQCAPYAFGMSADRIEAEKGGIRRLSAPLVLDVDLRSRHLS